MRCFTLLIPKINKIVRSDACSKKNLLTKALLLCIGADEISTFDRLSRHSRKYLDDLLLRWTLIPRLERISVKHELVHVEHDVNETTDALITVNLSEQSLCRIQTCHQHV